MLTEHEKQELSSVLATARGRVGADAIGEWVTEARQLLTAEAFDAPVDAPAVKAPKKKKKDAQGELSEQTETTTDGDA